MSIPEQSKAAPRQRPDTYLFVGELQLWLSYGQRVPEMRAAHFSDFDDVSENLMTILRPDVVISPLFAQSFDASELAQLLVELGFKGRYRAVSAPLPNPQIILREIRAQAPRLDFDLTIITPSGVRNLSGETEH